MIKEHRISEMLYEKCQQVIEKSGSWNCRCPLCGDSKTKLNVRRFHVDFYPTYNTYMYKCHRCGESNNVYSLYSKLYDVSFKEARKQLDDTEYNPKRVKDRIKKPVKKIQSNVQTELDIDLDEECYCPDDKPESHVGKKLIVKLKEFIKKRKITDICYIAHSGRYKSRIIIPVINNDVLEYFQGRSLYSDVEPKYLNPIVEKTPIIYHKNTINSNRDIIVTEGLIDANSVGNQCTSTLGADLADKKIKLLLKLTDESIIVCMDNDDAGIKSIKSIIEKSRYAKILKYFIMPNKYIDIKDMNKLLTSKNIANIEKFITDNSYSYFYVKTLLKIK